MKRVQRWRYYCDHCGKASGSGGHMRRHEGGCTANPNRVCGYCGRTRPVAELGDLLGSRGADWQAGMAALRAETGGCPGCILAALRQGRHHQPRAGEPWEPGRREGIEWATAAGEVMEFGFDFVEEKAAWWRNHPRPPRPSRGVPELDARGALAERLQAALGPWSPDAWAYLLEEVGEIRLSSRAFHQRLTDLYATALDYDPAAPTTRAFWDRVMTFALEGRELKPGLRGLPVLEESLNCFLDYAERQAQAQVPMTMAAWAASLDLLLRVPERDLLERPAEVVRCLTEGLA